MLNNIRSKQAILIVAIVLLVGFLFSRDVKGLVKPAEKAGKTATPAETGPLNAPTITIEEVSATAKNLVSVSTSKEISILEREYQTAGATEKLVLAQQLAQKWGDVEQHIPGAMYAEVIANAEPTLKNWLAAGGSFLKAFENTRDSLIQPTLLLKANSAFKSALSIDSTSNDAKTGLGITIVNGMGAPMQGITMLLDVVKAEPKNYKANIELGSFAIRSGQFDKAIVRFNNVISNIKATPDAYFYLATAYESLGKNVEAIGAYLNAKKLAANPTFTKFIDNKVAELKNKR